MGQSTRRRRRPVNFVFPPPAANCSCVPDLTPAAVLSVAGGAEAGGALFMNKGFGVAKKKPPRKKSKAVGFSYTGQLRPGTQTPRRSVSASRELKKKKLCGGCAPFVRSAPFC